MWSRSKKIFDKIKKDKDILTDSAKIEKDKKRKTSEVKIKQETNDTDFEISGPSLKTAKVENNLETNKHVLKKENIDINLIAQAQNILNMNLKFINLLEIMGVGIIGR